MFVVNGYQIDISLLVTMIVVMIVGRMLISIVFRKIKLYIDETTKKFIKYLWWTAWFIIIILVMLTTGWNKSVTSQTPELYVDDIVPATKAEIKVSNDSKTIEIESFKNDYDKNREKMRERYKKLTEELIPKEK